MTIETHNTNPIKTTKSRRWFRFRLRTLLVMVMLLSVPLGWAGWEMDQRRKEKSAIAWIEEMGGHVFPFSFLIDKRSWWEKKKDWWFGERVRIVSLVNTQVNDLSPLIELKNLSSLNLWTTDVSDVSPLAGLKNLEFLYLRNTPVNDLSPLAVLKNLKWLYLNDTQVSDLSALRELKNLETLDLSGTKVSDLSPLAELKKLKVLCLRSTQVSDEQVQELKRALPNCKIEFYSTD